VYANLQEGYTVHLKLNDRVLPIVRTGGSAQIPCFIEMMGRFFGPEKVVLSDVFNSVTAGQVVGGVCFLASLATTYALGRRLTGKRWAAWLAGMVVAVNGRMVWAGLSALEICLFATLSLLAVNAHLSDRAARRYRLRTAALFGLAALSRPECYLLFALSLADFVWNNWRRPEHASRIIPRRLPLLPVVLFVAIVLPYLLFSLRTGGHLLPNTYHAKAVVDFRLDRDFLSVAARYLILDNPLLLPFYVLGVVVLLCPALAGSKVRLSGAVQESRASLLGLWSAGLPLVYAFLHAALYQHGRYLIPLIPCNAIIGVVGLLEARRYLTPRPPSLRGKGGRLDLTPRPPSLREKGGRLDLTPWPSFLRGKGGIVVLVSLLVVIGTAWRLPAMARLYAWNVDNINEMHVALGRWAVEYTPPDALLALNDIGAITYVSERPVVDLAGLVTPEVVPLLRFPDRDARLADFMAERGVQYVIIFPTWFPDLAARDDVLEPVHQVALERNTICGGQTMVVYRTHWPSTCANGTGEVK